MSERTTGPWRLSGKSSIRAGAHNWIATVNWCNRDANAAFIVRVANSFDTMVEALREARSDLSEMSGGGKSRPDMSDRDGRTTGKPTLGRFSIRLRTNVFVPSYA